MGTPLETVPRPTTRNAGRGTVDERSGQGAGQVPGQAGPSTLKELAAKVLARTDSRDIARDVNRDTVRKACPTAPELPRRAGQSPAFVSDTRWRDYFEERAAMRENGDGISRAEAESAALHDCAQRWRAENPLAPAPQSSCARCGRAVKAADAMPVLAAGGHAWLHADCYPAMREDRIANSIASVRASLAAAP